MSSATSTEVIPVFLNPRPLARSAGRFILLPLLPYRPSLKPLPLEIWSKILSYVFDHYEADTSKPRWAREELRQGLLAVCKELQIVALPLFYGHVHITSLPCLQKFTERLHTADQKWDSIRRIPYSTPGRWVQRLGLWDLNISLMSEAYTVDALLTQLFPLLPFLEKLTLNPSLTISSRVVKSLSYREGIANLRSIKGIKLDPSPSVSEDAFVDLLCFCINLEELDVVGSGIDITDFTMPDTHEAFDQSKSLQLPRLRKLVLLSTSCSPLMYALLHSSLPSLRYLIITPYDESFVPTSLVPRFIQAHGQMLTSLHLFTPKVWPVMLLPSPVTILQTCPNLYHLSLEDPLPVLALRPPVTSHDLHILSIPRPRPEFLTVLESLLPKMPSLTAVRARDVRWLRPGMSMRAQQAGVQGEMVEWKRRLARRGIQMLDAEWKPGAQ